MLHTHTHTDHYTLYGVDAESNAHAQFKQNSTLTYCTLETAAEAVYRMSTTFRAVYFLHSNILLQHVSEHLENAPPRNMFIVNWL